MELEGEKVVIQITWDPEYQPKDQLTDLDYSRKVQNFDEIFGAKNPKNSNFPSLTSYSRGALNGNKDADPKVVSLSASQGYITDGVGHVISEDQ